MLCLWWAALAAALGAGARAQQARPVCPSGQAEHCVYRSYHRNGHEFLVHGEPVTYYFVDGEYFHLMCRRGIDLDEPALPRFVPALRVREVRLVDCWPRAGSYAAALRALNVTGPGGAPPAPTYYIDLQLVYVQNFNVSVLADMPTLRNLSIFNTRITPADLALLPAALERLKLLYTETVRVPAAALARLPRLGELEVVGYDLGLVEAAGNLRSLSITSTAAQVSMSLPDTLVSLRLNSWAPHQPEPWHSCAGLDLLQVEHSEADALPDGWLGRCARLRTLKISEAVNLKTLPAGALRGATALEVVRVSSTALEALPAGLLDDAPALRELDLSYNRLHTLPGQFFQRSTSLRALDLSNNKLDDSVLDALTALSSLTVLSLAYNTALDACPRARDVQGLSPLRGMHNLTQLYLARTGTRRVCADWRRLRRIQRLDLSHTDIQQITYKDIEFDTEVDLHMVVPDVAFSLTREDYARVLAAPAGPTLTLELRRQLRCDCELYWAVAALRAPNKRLRETGGRCDDGRALRDVPFDSLQVCACARTSVNTTRARVLRLDCAGAWLRRVPRVPERPVPFFSQADTVELHLAYNSIQLLTSEDLPSNLTALDLRNNSLRLIDAATVAALVSRPGLRVWLAGNPLDCGCRAAAALAAMRARTDVFLDWANGTCSNGTRLSDAEPVLAQSCHYDTTTPAPRSVPEVWGGSGPALGASLTLGGVAVVALAWLAVWRRRRAARRARLPATLRLERLDAREWVYDAFVAFAHADEAVVRELVERLEGGAAPLRLCVHYRDWMPGGWIPTQIAASVRLSRRTVAVVSEAFLRSKWARAEFREAYAAGMEDGEPRLVLVLLEDPARLPLDAELRACVTGSTYVRWGDAWFWEKLQRALPAPIVRP